MKKTRRIINDSKRREDIFRDATLFHAEVPILSIRKLISSPSRYSIEQILHRTNTRTQITLLLAFTR